MLFLQKTPVHLSKDLPENVLKYVCPSALLLKADIVYEISLNVSLDGGPQDMQYRPERIIKLSNQTLKVLRTCWFPDFVCFQRQGKTTSPDTRMNREQQHFLLL